MKIKKYRNENVFFVYRATLATSLSFYQEQVCILPLMLSHCCDALIVLSLCYQCSYYYWLPFSSLVDCFCLISWHMDTHGFCYWFCNLKAPSYGIHSVGLLDWLWSQLQMCSLMHLVQLACLLFILQLWNLNHLLLNFIQTHFHEDLFFCQYL